MSRILVVDDKELMRDSVATTLSRKGHVVITASTGATAIEKLVARPVDAVITDLQMPGMDGLELLKEIRTIDEQLPVIFMTAYGTVETAVTALKQGAYDYITKPFSGDELIVAVERALETRRLVKENQILHVAAAGPDARSHHHEMIGSSPVVAELREKLDRIGASHGTVLIAGESGAGKEVAARRIHEASPRSGAPFLAINCAALSTSLLESELFGHERGAFTGADKMRKGRFELADGGTLLLDEISEIAPSIQAKLLRVLQEQSFERVGSSRALSVDVRVIATTNRHLPAEVAKGTFRQDLYYRLNVLPVTMPALRAHRDDLRELSAHFLAGVASPRRHTVKRFDDEANAVMEAYIWPGNVRELQNICERASVLANDEVIPAALIRPWLSGERLAANGVASTVEAKPEGWLAVDNCDNGGDLGVVCNGTLTLDDVERESIIATLIHHDGHRQKSARALGIGVRTLGLKLKKWKEQQLVAQTL